MTWSGPPCCAGCTYSASMVDEIPPKGRGSRSCDDDKLSGRVIRFHDSVRLGNLIEAIHVIDGYYGIAGSDGVEKLLQYSRGQIIGVAAIGGKAYATRDVVDRG